MSCPALFLMLPSLMLEVCAGAPVQGRPMQTEQGISDVIHRARQHRLQRRTGLHIDAAAGASSSSSFGQSSPASQGSYSRDPGMREE